MNKITKKIVRFLINLIPVCKWRKRLRHKLLWVKYVPLNRKIPSSFQSPDLLFLFTTNTSNIGDIQSSPAHYFDFSATPILLDIVSTLNNEQIEKTVIIGGGIHPWLFGDYEFYRRIKSNKNIAWGIGTFAGDIYSSQVLSKFSLIGLRECDSPMIDNKKVFYVPCASCMSSVFDLKFPPSEDVVFYLHSMFTPKEFLQEISQYSVMSNYNHSFLDVVKFLSQGKVVVTNSYHGMYWATLLGRKVVCIDIHNKCKGVKWKPVFATYDNWREQLSRAKIHPFALKEARELNVEFYNKVVSLLRL